MPGSAHGSASARRRAVARWRRSGLSAADFAPMLGVSPSTLYSWSRLARDGSREPRPAGPMIELVPAETPGRSSRASRGPIEIDLRNGRTIRVGGDVDADVLARVIRVAEEA